MEAISSARSENNDDVFCHFRSAGIDSLSLDHESGEQRASRHPQLARQTGFVSYGRRHFSELIAFVRKVLRKETFLGGKGKQLKT